MDLKLFDIVKNPGKDAYIDLCKEVYTFENWICGKEDYECYENSFGNEFEFLIVFEKGTKNVAASAMLIYIRSNEDDKPEFSGFGFYFVTPKHRGTGMGKCLSDLLLRSDKFVNTNGFLMCPDPQMSEKYALCHGFNKIVEWHQKIYTMMLRDIIEINIHENIFDDMEIRHPMNEDWEKIFKYHADIAGRIRFDLFLKNWLTAKDTFTLVMIEKRTGNIVGLGHAREAYMECLQIGPLLADSSRIAEVLLKKLIYDTASHTDYDSVIFSFPSNNIEAVNLVRKMSCGKATNSCNGIIQFTKEIIRVDTKRIFSGVNYILFVV